MYKNRYQSKAAGKMLTTVEFDSLVEFSDISKFNTPREEEIYRNSVKSYFNNSADYQKNWFGASSESDTRRILQQGDPEFVELVQKYIPKDGNNAMSIKRKTIKSDHGDELCPHEVNNGNISRAWRRKKRAVGNRTRGVEIVVNIAGNCNIEATAFAKCGATALALAQYLYDAGYSVKITGVVPNEGITSSDNAIMTFPIKDWMAPLDIQALSSVCCFAGFFRACGFVRFGLVTDGSLSPGLGRTMDKDKTGSVYAEAFPLQGGHQRLFIPAAEFFSKSVTPEKVIKESIEKLKRAPADILAAA